MTLTLVNYLSFLFIWAGCAQKKKTEKGRRMPRGNHKKRESLDDKVIILYSEEKEVREENQVCGEQTLCVQKLVNEGCESLGYFIHRCVGIRYTCKILKCTYFESWPLRGV